MNMRSRKTQLRQLLCSIATTLAIGGTALADDTEIYLGVQTATAAPNILFVFDTSGSMGSIVSTTAPYDPATNYFGISGNSTCSNSRIYYAEDGRPPSCTTSRYFNVSDFKCAAAATPLAT